MENIVLYRRLERNIAHTDEVEAALGDHAFVILAQARSILAGHRKTGEHKVTQTKGNVDHFVNLEGPAALSVEEGWHNERTGTFVRGLDILKGALR